MWCIGYVEEDGVVYRGMWRNMGYVEVDGVMFRVCGGGCFGILG